MSKCTKCQDELTENNSYKRVRRGRTEFQAYCRKCNSKNTTKRARKLKQECVEYKGGKCQKCGYDKCIGAMDFHHLDKAQKDFTVSNNHLKAFKNVKDELDKCILLCSNCHREEHYLN